MSDDAIDLTNRPGSGEDPQMHEVKAPDGTEAKIKVTPPGHGTTTEGAPPRGYVSK